jgi:hypothetical protein
LYKPLCMFLHSFLNILVQTAYRRGLQKCIYIVLIDLTIPSIFNWSRDSRGTKMWQVEVTLRPTVSRPLRLGVLSLLEQVTRCYIYLSDNYFIYFSCRSPSLRGRVCNLQCNDASSVSSYIATDGLWVSSSWCRAPNGAHNQILISLFDSYFVFSV